MNDMEISTITLGTSHLLIATHVRPPGTWKLIAKATASLDASRRRE
jgi:hypothetical protein